jgi:5-methylcytosine-specific restriction endonuclease McrA
MTNDESIIKYNKNLTQEHIIPVSLGGDYTKENIIPACLGCNSSKSNKSLDDFYKRKIGVFTKQRYYKIINYIKLVTSKEGA